MKLRRLRMCGVGDCWTAPLDLDLDRLPEGVIAIVGSNGRGKTHLLECLSTATLYRRLAGYGEPLARHIAAGVRDARTDLSFEVNGERYRAVVQCDPEADGGKGKSEAYLYRGGEPIAGPNVTEYDAAVLQLLGPPTLFCVSVFAAQGGAGRFTTLDKKDRRDLFARMIGADHYQVQSEAARQRGQKTTDAVDQVRAQIAAATERLDRRSEIERQLGESSGPLSGARNQLAAVEAELSEAQAKLAGAREDFARAEAEAAGVRDRRQLAESVHAQAVAEVARLEERLEGLNASLAQADQVERAAAALAAAVGALDTIAGDERKLADELRPVAETVARLQARREALVREYRNLRQQIQDAAAATERLRAEPELLRRLQRLTGERSAAATELSGREQAVESAQARVDQESAIASRRSVLKAREEALLPRVDLLAGIDLEHGRCVHCGRDCRACPLTEDARQADEALRRVQADLAALPAATDEARNLLDSERARCRSLRETLATLDVSIESLRAEVAALADCRAAAAGAERAADDLARNVQAGGSVKIELEREAGAKVELERRMAQTSQRRAELEAERDRHQALAARLSEVRAAAVKRDEVDVALRQARTASARARRELDAVPAPPDLGPLTAAVTAAESSVASITETHRARAESVRTMETARAELEGVLTVLGDPATDVATLSEREANLVQSAEDWSLLEKSLGRDGVQALLLAAAGPGVTQIANDILYSCYGNRFSIVLETTEALRSARKGERREREVFNLRVLDAEQPMQNKEQVSPGQMAPVDEALRLAFAIYNIDRSGVELRTLFRDEADQALTLDHADQYVQMLRRALALRDFQRVFIVSHKPEVFLQADGWILVEDGTARIVELEEIDRFVRGLPRRERAAA